MPSAPYFYAPDVDAIYKQAKEAGAISISEAQDYHHGDRNAAIQDKWESQQWFATSKDFPDDEKAE